MYGDLSYWLRPVLLKVKQIKIKNLLFIENKISTWNVLISWLLYNGQSLSDLIFFWKTGKLCQK